MLKRETEVRSQKAERSLREPASRSPICPERYLKEIAQRQVIGVVDAHSLPNVRGPKLRGFEADDDIRRQMVIEIAAEQKILANAAGIQIAVTIVLLPGKQVKI